MPEQKQLFFWNNQNLFSNNYLEHRLPAASLWKEQEEKAGDVFDIIKKLYEAIKPLKLGSGEEAGIEEKFIRPVLKTLGYEFDVQPRTPSGYKKKRPDYALFKDSASYEEARRGRDNISRFFMHPVTILEAKSWGRRLNDTDPKDTIDTRDPTAQTVKYLDDVYHASQGRIQWAILTNGKEWRLFYYRAASRSGNFFEINLENIITENDRGKFLYFYLFFSRDAFIPDLATGKTWLDQHLDGSEAYAKAVSARLKDLIFDEVFEGLARGFVHYRQSELGIREETEETRKAVFEGCLTILYRLLFLLYAESRDLLPVKERGYFNNSLKKLKEDISKDLLNLGPERMSKRSYTYWARLESIFNIIAKGDPALNVPIYNGGLFETPADSFLSGHKLPDPFLAAAIGLLTIDQECKGTPGTAQFIDYSSLNVRHLGDIYEGLLEFHVQVADEAVAEVKEKDKSFWRKLSEVKEGTKTFRKKAKDDVYIENSKHERKATGSYYTPHYIVEYIVKNTVGPVLDERFERGKKILSELDSLYKKQRRQLKKRDKWKHWEHPGEPKGELIDEIIKKENDIFETVFDIKTLDPSMGSGHFLVHAVDYISDRIITFLADYPENPVIRRIEEIRSEILKDVAMQGVKIDEDRLTEVNLIKRTVMKRCIYGVDLNEMAVELAKLSLWLDSFTLGAPLSFLDHHLKCGNSLIGILDISSVIIPNTESYGKVQRALSFMLQVSDLTDATISEAKKSYDLFWHAQQEIEPIKRRFNVAIAKHFTDLGKNIGGLEQLAYTMVFDKEPFPENIERCKRVLSIAKEKKFFHWKLEFPEVFYTERGEKENPGFDCVIGNPPYGVAFDALSKEFLNNKYIAAEYQLESFTLFIEQAVSLLKQSGLHAYITPTTWLSMHYYENLRGFVLENNHLQQVIFFKEPVFEDATVETCIEIVQKGKPDEKAAIMLGVVSDKPGGINIRWVNIPQQKIITFEGKRITEYLNPTTLQLFEKINAISSPIKHIGNICNGLKPYEVGKGSPPQTKKTVEHRVFDANWRKDETYKPYLRGEDFHKYSLEPQELRWISYGEWLAATRPTTPFFAPKKIVIRQTSDTIIATIDDKQYLNLNNVHNLVLKADGYSLEFILALLNSKLLSFLHTMIVPEFGRVFAEVKIVNLEKLPIPRISFTTPGEERKKRASQGIGLYEEYMLEFESQGVHYDKTANEANKTVAEPHAGGEKEAVSGKHPGAGKRVHGLRGRTGKRGRTEGVSEDPEGYDADYESTTRFIESSLGIKSYKELAPHLAKGVERVMASLLTKKPEELQITQEFISSLHRDAFSELFPDWAGRDRDRDVRVGGHTPPSYYEVPILMRRYCEDLEARLASIGSEEHLVEAIAFAEGRFLTIHPFRDFNGRVARMLLFAILYRLDLPPVELIPDEKDREGRDRYLKALSEADKSNWQSLAEIWKERLGKGMM